jgi:thiamine-phosphate pyrophosphorylase
MTVLMGLQARLRLARLYLCTDARTGRGDLAEFCEAVFAGGVDILQIRQKDMDPDEELEALQVARRAAERHQGLVCVNDSPSLAERFSADVLHLGQTDGSSRRARKHLHRWALIGRSTHAPAQTDRALADDDADYFCVGPVYATSTKPDYEPVGLDLVRYAARVAPPHDLAARPWFAIGGIDEGNLDDVLAAGARRVCVVRALTLADDPEAAARSLSTRLREAWRADPAMERYTLGAAGFTGPTR